MQIEPLTGTLGAIIHDLDLAEPEHLPWDRLRAAWLRHRVLFFRGQPLRPQQLVGLAARSRLLPPHRAVPVRALGYQASQSPQGHR